MFSAALLAAGGRGSLSAAVNFDNDGGTRNQQDLPGVQQLSRDQLPCFRSMAEMQSYADQFEFTQCELDVLIGEEVELAVALPAMYPVCLTILARPDAP